MKKKRIKGLGLLFTLVTLLIIVNSITITLFLSGISDKSFLKLGSEDSIDEESKSKEISSWKFKLFGLDGNEEKNEVNNFIKDNEEGDSDSDDLDSNSDSDDLDSDSDSDDLDSDSDSDDLDSDSDSDDLDSDSDSDDLDSDSDSDDLDSDSEEIPDSVEGTTMSFSTSVGFGNL